MTTPFEEFLRKQGPASAEEPTSPETEPAITQPEAPEPTQNVFADYMAGQGVELSRESAVAAKPAETAPTIEEDPGLYSRAIDFTSRSLIEQLVGGYHDYRERANKSSAVTDVERIKETQEGKYRDLDPAAGGPLGMSARDFKRSIEFAAGGERRDAVLKQQLEQDTERLADHIKSAKEHGEKGKLQPLSPETMEFLDENSDKSIGEAFADAPGTIIMELGMRSMVASSEGIGLGMALGAVGSTVGGPVGGIAGFGAGMAAGSARVEYAASLVEVFDKNGVDWEDPESIMALVSDDQFMQDAQKYATARAAIIGGVDGLSGLIGAKHFTPGIKNTIARELANAGIQLPIQAAMGAGGETLGQLATLEEGEELNLRDIAAEAAGEMVTAPVEIAGAAYSGARQRGGDVDLEPESSPLQQLEDRQDNAREEVAEEGGDALEQELAAALEATMDEIEIDAAIEELAAADQAALDAQEAELTGERETEAAQAAEQLGHALTRQERTADFEQAEAEQVEAKEAEERAAFEERELRTEMEKGVEIEQEAAREAAIEEQPDAPTLGDVMPEEVKAMAEPEPEIEVVPPKEEVPLIEDKRPIVVTPEGEAFTTADQDAGRQQQADLIDEEAQKAATSPVSPVEEPTEAQKKAGNYKKGHVSVQGMDISIENPVGSVRKFQRDDGSTGEQEMQDHYGYVRRTEGADGDQVDVFIGDQPDADTVFVVDQVNQETGQFDEHKVMMGYPNQLAATRAYRRNYEKGFQVGKITPMSVKDFKSWLKEGSTTSPLQPIAAPRPAPTVATEAQVAEVEEAATRRAPRRQVRYRADGTTPAPAKKVTAKQATAAVAKVAKTTPGIGNIGVVDTASIPEEVRARVEEDGQTNAKGFYDPESDTMYVLADNHTSEADVQKTVLHETVAHKGLRTLFPEREQFDEVMRDVLENANPTGLERIAKRYDLDLAQPGDSLVAAEEYIASIAEGDIDPGIMQRVVDAVRAALRKLGAVTAWSDNDIRALLRDARSSMRGKPLSEVTVVSEAEVAETGERIEIEEPADVAIRQHQKRIGIIQQLQGCIG